MFKDYARCISFESDGNLVRSMRVAGGVLRARIKYGLGPRHYSLFRFLSTPETKWCDYLTDKQFYLEVIRGKYPEPLQQRADNKALFYQHCLEHDLPVIPVICFVGQAPDQFTSEVAPSIDSFDQWKRVIEDAPDDVFIKPIDSSHGQGAFVVRRYGQQFMIDRDETPRTIHDLYQYVLDRANHETALLIQPRVRPHPKILEISAANGLATARVVTVKTEDSVRIVIASARLPVGTNVTDNFCDGASGNLVAAIDVKTGSLSEAWGAARADWPLMRSTESHPDTGKKILGRSFPFWPEVADVALRAQSSMPELNSVGWDVAVTSDGVVLVEANCGYGIQIHQVAHQRGVGREILSAVGS